MKKLLMSLSALAVLASASPAYAATTPVASSEPVVQEAQQIVKYYALRPNELSEIEGIYLKKGQELTISVQGNYAYYSAYDSSNNKIGTYFKSNVNRIFTAKEDGYLYVQFLAPSSFTINHMTATYTIN